MKTKKLLICLLFLILGTTASWADKYYRMNMKARVETGKLQFSTGKKYMIFNTTIDQYGNPRYGFLYNMGTTFGLHRSTSVDQFIYNGAFVFELEDAGDDDPHTFYLKSVPSGGYMDVYGHQSATPVKLNLYTWDEARGKDDADDSNDDVYTVATNGVSLNDKNELKQECVKSLNKDYTAVSEHLVTSGDNHVFLIANEDTTVYFNGNPTSYATYEKGHPYAFYECYEVTSVGSFDMQDLHMYSRADAFSAQKMYGYIKSADQISHNDTWTEGSKASLIDGDFKTSITTDWGSGNTTEVHYFQIDLGTSVESLRLYMATRPDGTHAPLNYELWATNNPAGEWTQITFDGDAKTLNSSLDTRLAYISPVINLGGSYQHIRLQAPGVNNRTKSDAKCLALSELYVLPNRDEINSAIAYFDNSLPVAATEGTYKEKIDSYNNNPAATGAKLFSGVPIPGNKYRIYADAYSGGAYVNRHISINAEGKALTATGDYDTAIDKSLYEWYCEKTPDGKLLFRNAKFNTLYLTNQNGSYVTATVDSAKWTINTNLTQHHGVPLLSTMSTKYLAVNNSGAPWIDDVHTVQNQTQSYTYTHNNGTPNDAEDDYEVTINEGICTDFVFIPVDLDENDVCLTITASELTNRNSALSVGGTVYELPFSKVFYKNAIPEITATSTAGEFHVSMGFYKDGTHIGDIINEALFTNSTLKSGDVVELRFQVNESKLPKLSTEGNEGNIILYRIKNRRAYGAPQHAGMNRTGLDYDDGFTSMENNKYNYYASFYTNDQPLDLLYRDSDIKANSFFYFTSDTVPAADNYAVHINSAITTFRLNKPNDWNTGGTTYYIQPNAVNDNVHGFAITQTPLNSTNNPYGFNAYYGSDGATVVEHYVEDANSAWEFVQVDDAVATEKLTLYIKETAANMIVDLTGKLNTPGFDNDKINHTIGVIETIAGKYNEADSTFSGGNIIGATVTSLVGYAQELHMLHHKVEYAMQELPVATNEHPDPEDDFQPQWYYVKNVNTGYYAHYKGAENLMDLTQNVTDADGELSHLFYFAGEVLNKGTTDEHLKAHIHNFMALNLKDATKDSTVVSYNKELFVKNDIAPVGDGNQTVINLTTEQQLKSGEAWQLTLNFDLSNGAFFNGWGSGLLASGTNATIDGGAYSDGFQVYLQNSGNVVIRGGDSGANDEYKFTHTVGKYATLKIVLTYANKRLQVEVTNSEGITQSIKDTKKGKDNKGRDYIPCNAMEDIGALVSATAGSTRFDMKADVVLAMKWDTHENNVANSATGDTWYILPSSNTLHPGLAIVTGSADDANMGWSNVNGENKEIFTAPGTDDYSTWQFEKVENFEEYIKDLLELYDIKDCVIYNEELTLLFKTINKLKENGNDNKTFNDIFNAIRAYSGPTPEEFKAPKPGSLYKIRPAEDEKTKNALLVHVDRQNTHYATTELYKGVAVDNAGDTDSRAVWMFEGTPGSDGFLPLTGLKAKNIHTQTYLGALGADATKLAGTGTAIMLAPLGECTTSFKVGDNYMSMVGDNNIYYQKESAFWGYAVTEYPNEINGVTNGFAAGKVHCKSLQVNVATEGNVKVTFTHAAGGSHKLNILGVTLSDSIGNEVKEYHHGKAGGEHVNNEYDLGTVAAGTYTLDCYVWNFDAEGGENDKVDMAQGNITIAGAESVTGLTNTGTENTKWIVEEILNPEENVCYTTTIEDGYSTLMLGFDAKIPTGIEAYYGATDGIVIDKKYLSMEKYEGNVLPARAPVVLRNSTEGVTVENAKFFYSKIGGEKQEDNYLNGKLWYTIVLVDEGVNLYMLQQEKTGPKMYWIYEEYNAKGDKVSPGADTGGYVACKANKAYILIDNGEAQSNGVFLFSFRPGETTGIYNIADEKYRNENGSVVEGIFDLQGRKLNEITQPGIYIVNGKKVIIK